MKPVADEFAMIARAFAPRLLEDDLYDLLAFLNARDVYRFTGVYRFAPGWVMSVALFDREAPLTRLGANVKMKESYCWLTGLGDRYVIEDAQFDPRLSTHAARETVRAYQAVVLRDRHHAPWGTICHFDFAPRAASTATVAQLVSLQPLIEEMFVRESVACWMPDEPSRQRISEVSSGGQAAELA